MTQKEADQVNNVLRTIVISIAVALAIGAFIHNPAHLFTAGIIFVAGLEMEVAKADEFDLRK